MPSIWGDGALSVIQHSGLLEDMAEHYEVDDEQGLTAICTMRRRDRPTPVVTRFSMAMAERAGLMCTDGPWQTYPERMLRMRARSWTMRDAFADVLRGLQLREEVEDFVGSRRGGPPTDPRRDGRPPRSERHYASPRPRRYAGYHSPHTPDDRPAAVSGPSGGSSDGETAAEPVLPADTYALVDADGVVIEIAGPEALRTEFEGLFFDKHLSPDQVIGVWESNEPARQAIEGLFGFEVLAQAREHLRSGGGSSRALGGDQPEVASCETAADHEESTPAVASEPGRTLALEISPAWGIQKIFHHYRAGLTALTYDQAQDKSMIAGFRAANIAVEEHLRAKLPRRMREVDAIYQRAGLAH